MKSFKQHIFEKLKVTPNSVTVHKEYINNTKEVTKYTAYKYHKYILKQQILKYQNIQLEIL